MTETPVTETTVTETTPAAEVPMAEYRVLPWWQNPVNILTMIVTAALLAGMLGWLVGQSGNDVESSEVDVGFLQDMRVHHEQAVELSTIFLDRPGIDGGLGTIARGIAFGQAMEIGIMIQLLRDMDAATEREDGRAMAWMGMPGPDSAMPGMAGDDQIDALAGSQGADADRLFVDLMVAHHEGGIDMIDAALDDAENPDVRRYAEAWRAGQAGEIVELQSRLSDPATSND